MYSNVVVSNIFFNFISSIENFDWSAGKLYWDNTESFWRDVRNLWTEKLDESKTAFKMDQFLSNLPYQDLNGNNTKQTDLENMTAQAKVHHEVIKGNFDNPLI